MMAKWAICKILGKHRWAKDKHVFWCIRCQVAITEALAYSATAGVFVLPSILDEIANREIISKRMPEEE